MTSRNDIDGFEGQDARGIANFILEKFDPMAFEISNLKLNKLLFFAHGFYRSRYNQRLIRNHFEAWKNGPVVRVVFDSFKKNGRLPIRNKALIYDYMTSSYHEARWDDFSSEVEDYLVSVLNYYVQFDAGQLVGLTHRSGTPWHRAWNSLDEMRLSDRIPDQWIDEFFVDNFGGRHSN